MALTPLWKNQFELLSSCIACMLGSELVHDTKNYVIVFFKFLAE